MSQEGGMFSVRRTRETLGPVSHNVSAIPMPASAMKRSTSNTNLQQAPHTTNHVRTVSGSRMSLAPGRPPQPVFQRSSSGHDFAGMAGFSTVQRPSTANFLGTGTGRKSIAPVLSTPAPPSQSMQESTQRRSSVYSARPSAAFGPTGHQSFFASAPPPKNQPQDPRAFRTVPVKQQMVHDLSEFLAQRNFELVAKHTLSAKSMTDPTGKDFEKMFQFLYHCIDPAYRFRNKIDEEVISLMKQLKYPWAGTFTRSKITAVGSNNWPDFLAMLHWMMQLARMMEAYSTGQYDDACIEAGFDVTPDRITFQFLSDAYKEWLSIEDDDDEEEEAKRRIQPHVDAMAAKFEQANEANLEQLKQLEAEAKALQAQIDELGRSAPLLADLNEKEKALKTDIDALQVWINDTGPRIERKEAKNQRLQEGVEQSDAELQEAEKEHDELQRKVDEKGISIQQIDQMNSERERLQKSIEATTVRLEEAKERTSQKESETSAKLDELEALVQKHNSLAYTIGIIPPSAPRAEGHNYELSLNINRGPDFTASQLGSTQQNLLAADRLLSTPTEGYAPQTLLSSAPAMLKRGLQDIRKAIRERRTAALEEEMANNEIFEKMKEALEDNQVELEGLEHKVRIAEEEYQRAREQASAQGMKSDAQIEMMENKLGKIRGDLGESVVELEQREMYTNLEYEQLTLRSTALREELHTELERMLNDVIKFKIHIQGSLEAYEEFVAQEVERECEEQEAGLPAGGSGGGVEMEE